MYSLAVPWPSLDTAASTHARIGTGIEIVMVTRFAIGGNVGVGEIPSLRCLSPLPNGKRFGDFRGPRRATASAHDAKVTFSGVMGGRRSVPVDGSKPGHAGRVPQLVGHHVRVEHELLGVHAKGPLGRALAYCRGRGISSCHAPMHARNAAGQTSGGSITTRRPSRRTTTSCRSSGNRQSRGRRTAWLPPLRRSVVRCGIAPE